MIRAWNKGKACCVRSQWHDNCWWKERTRHGIIDEEKKNHSKLFKCFTRNQNNKKGSRMSSIWLFSIFYCWQSALCQTRNWHLIFASMKRSASIRIVSRRKRESRGREYRKRTNERKDKKKKHDVKIAQQIGSATVINLSNNWTGRAKSA